MMLAPLLACFALQAEAPQDPAPLRELPPGSVAEKYVDVAARLVGRALVQNQGMETLELLCDDIGPRLSGSEAADRAVAWCVERMQAQGFHNVRAQPVMVPVWRRGHCDVRMVAPREQELAAVALGGSVGTEGPLTAPVVEVESFEELDALGRDALAGKIVFYHFDMEPSTATSTDYGTKVRYRTQGAAKAAQYGALASVIRSVGTDRMYLPHTGTMYYDSDGAQIPAVALAYEDAELLHRLLRRGREVSLSLDLGCETLPDRESANVIAEVPGREKPEEVVVIGGHLDSWDVGTGAIDDGAGCVIAWEAARLLLELGLPPRRTVRVVLFMNEENGSRGADGYAAAVEEHIGQHVAAIESDSGSGRPLGFSCGGTEEGVALVAEIGTLLQGIGAGQVTPGGAGGVDIAPLYQRGVPCLGLRHDMTHYFDFHHSPADTFDKVDAHDLSLGIAAMAVMAYVLADVEERPPHRPIDASEQ